MKIEVITTNNEASMEKGFGSLESCNNILHSIEKIGYKVKLSICQNINDLKDVVSRKPDLVVLGVKYIIENEQKIWLCEFFSKNKINYSGSSKKTLMYDSDKVLAKSYLKDRGINTARYFTAIPQEHKRDYDLPINYPLFLKHSNSINGNGIDDYSLVNNFAEFQSKVLSLYDKNPTPILVEEYLDGREFTVAIIKTKSGNLLVSSLEIIQAKMENVNKSTPKKLIKIEDEQIIKKIKELAVDAYIDLGIRDYGRIDIKSNIHGHCYFMNVNLIPDMTSNSSYFPKACEVEHELSYDDMIELIVEEGISRVPLV
jgi:D-alanine-D-alanine ligase